MKGKDRPGTKQ